MSPQKNRSGSGSKPKFWTTPRFKEVTGSLLKKFGPLVLTALAHYVEHKWLEKSDEGAQNQEQATGRKQSRAKDGVEASHRVDRKSSVESLRRQIETLKRNLRRKDRAKRKRKVLEESSSSETTESTESSLVLESAESSRSATKETRRAVEKKRVERRRRGRSFHRPRYQEELPPEQYFENSPSQAEQPVWEQQRERYFRRQRTTSFNDDRPVSIPPRVPTPPVDFPPPFSVSQEQESQRRTRRSTETERILSGRSRSSSRDYLHRSGNHCDVAHHTRHRRHHHHRRHSYHNGQPPHEESSGMESSGMEYAGKVAAISGLIEAVHVCRNDGDWIGPKGARVATTAASSAAASYSRERDPEAWRKREVVADIGTGLFVSRLVHGSSRRVKQDVRGRKKRRWSYCY